MCRGEQGDLLERWNVTAVSNGYSTVFQVHEKIFKYYKLHFISALVRSFSLL